MKRLAGVLAAAALLASAPPAQASEGYCTTNRMSGMSFTLCRYYNPWQPSLSITCIDTTGYCTTRQG